MYNASQDLNVRDGGGVKNSIIGKLRKGSTVDILEVDKNWGKIDFEGQVGYVNVNFLKPESAKNNLHEKETGFPFNATNIVIILSVLIVAYFLRKTIIVESVLPVLTLAFSVFDKKNKGRQYAKYRCKACGELTSSYFLPYLGGGKCKSSKTHDWKRIT